MAETKGHHCQIVYHPAYNLTAFGLGRLHPFDGRKYPRIRDALIARGLRRPRDFVRPRPVGRRDLVKLDTPEYLNPLGILTRFDRV